jgi:sugar phosphate isomerase/epimerase
MKTTIPFRVGVTLHSFNAEYLSLKWSFEDMMELTSYLGGGVEIVGPAHQRGFPYLSHEFERQFKSSIERFELTPTAYGSYADPFTLVDRDFTPEELVAYTMPQLQAAVALGFPVVRLQYFVAPVVQKLMPYVEAHGLKIGYELHAPLTLESTQTASLLEQIRHINSPLLGVIPDMGIFARSVPQFRVTAARERGVPEPLLQQALRMWEENVTLDTALPQLHRMGLRAEHEMALEVLWGSFGRSDPHKLLEIMPHIIHFHGKYFNIVDGDEPDIRYQEAVETLLAGGYQGWLSSEYEGPGNVNSFDSVHGHQAMIQRYIDGYLASQG